MKKIYLAGDCLVLQQAFEPIRGVETVTIGKATADSGFEVRCVELEYNPKKTDICELLKEYFEAVDPYIIADEPLEQPAVLYCSAEDIPQIEYYARYMQNRGAEPAAALGNMILNDSITPGREIRKMQVNYGRLASFETCAD